MTVQKGAGLFRDYIQLEQEFDNKYVLLTRRGEDVRLGEGYANKRQPAAVQGAGRREVSRAL